MSSRKRSWSSTGLVKVLGSVFQQVRVFEVQGLTHAHSRLWTGDWLSPRQCRGFEKGPLTHWVAECWKWTISLSSSEQEKWALSQNQMWAMWEKSLAYVQLPSVLFFFFFYFQLKDNCLKVLCWFSPNISMNQPSVYHVPSHLNSAPWGSMETTAERCSKSRSQRSGELKLNH